MSPAMEPPRWRKDLSNAGEFVRKSVPVNKSSSSGEQGRRFPEVHSSLVRRALAFGSVGMGALTRRLHPERRSGRAQRFGELIAQALRDRFGLSADDLDVEVSVHESFGKPALISVDVAVSGLGVLDLVDRFGDSGALGVGDLGGDNADSDVIADGDQNQAHVAREIAEQCLQTAWNNPEIAPVAVRVSVRVAHAQTATDGNRPLSDLVAEGIRPSASGVLATVDNACQSAEGAGVLADEDAGGEMPVVATAKSLGFADETARPAELYQRFGAPAFDPTWRP